MRPQIWMDISAAKIKSYKIFSPTTESVKHARIWEARCASVILPVTFTANKVFTNWEAADTFMSCIQDHGLHAHIRLELSGSIEQILGLPFENAYLDFISEILRRYPSIYYITPISHMADLAAGATHTLSLLVKLCKLTALATRKILCKSPLTQIIIVESFLNVPKTPQSGSFTNQSLQCLAIDILTGRVNKGHPVQDELLSAFNEEEILWFQKNHVLALILALSPHLRKPHFAEPAITPFQTHSLGGNGDNAELKAQPVKPPPPSPLWIMEELWNRYRFPLLILANPLPLKQDQQILWLNQLWNSAVSLNAKGARVLGIIIKTNRNPALSKFIQALAKKRIFQHPVFYNHAKDHQIQLRV